MAVDVRPDRAVPVDVVAAPAISEKGARSADNDQGFLCTPDLLLGKGMPEMTVIPRREIFGIP